MALSGGSIFNLQFVDQSLEKVEDTILPSRLEYCQLPLNLVKFSKHLSSVSCL